MNREEAKRAGESRYIGKVCAKHPELSGLRYVANWICVSCQLDAVLRYARSAKGNAKIKAHRRTEKVREMYRGYKKRYRSNSEYRATEKAYQQSPKERARITEKNNRPERKAFMAQYQRRPEQKALRAIARRQRQQHVSRHATPRWANREEMAKYYAEAEKRTKTTGERHVVDHVVPIKHKLVCGLHNEFNLQVLTYQENAKKSNRFEAG